MTDINVQTSNFVPLFSRSTLKSNGFFFFLSFFLNEDDLSLIRKNRMALFQQLTCVLPILDNLLKANIINKQEHDIIKQKTQIPLQARELIDTVLVKGNAAANIFKNCLKEIDSALYKNLFGEFFGKNFLEILGIMFIFVFDKQ